jgi:hypothetical protein
MGIMARVRDGDYSHLGKRTWQAGLAEFAAKRKSKADNSKSHECFRDDGSSYRIAIGKVCGGAKTRKKPIETPKAKTAAAGVKKQADDIKQAGSFKGAIGGLKNGKQYDITPEMAKVANAMGVSDRQLSSGRVPKAVQADLIKEFDRLSGAGGKRAAKPSPDKPSPAQEIAERRKNLPPRLQRYAARYDELIKKGLEDAGLGTGLGAKPEEVTAVIRKVDSQLVKEGLLSPEEDDEARGEKPKDSPPPKPDPKIRAAIAKTLDDFEAKVKAEIASGRGSNNSTAIENMSKFAKAVKASDMRTDPIRNYETFRHEFSNLYDLAINSGTNRLVPISHIMTALSDRVPKQDARKWVVQMHKDGVLEMMDNGGRYPTPTEQANNVKPPFGNTWFFATRRSGVEPPAPPTEEARLKDERSAPVKPRTEKIRDQRDFAQEARRQISDILNDRNEEPRSAIPIKDLREKMSEIMSPQDFDKWLIEAHKSGAIEAQSFSGNSSDGGVKPPFGETWNVVKLGNG